MQVSNLESLPNEILIELFEKYINGVDIFAGFYSLNKRFIGLISQCTRFRLNFRHCQKENFQYCINRLLSTSYIEKIEELILCEENTPDQIQIFLSFFPTFISFKRLSKLYLHCHAKTIYWSVITQAIRSLSNTNINTFSLQINDTTRELTLDNIINEIMNLKSLKKFYLNDNIYQNRWISFNNDSFEIANLTHLTMSCELEYLKHIFQRFHYLKYLNIQLTSDSIFGYQGLINLGPNHLPLILNLHTLILSFSTDDLTTLDKLEEYFKLMPSLYRLEIKAHIRLLDANAWEDVLQISLPSLNYFILKTTKSRINLANIENLLSSFETSFWIEKENFYFIITEHKTINTNQFISIKDQDEFQLPVIRWWIVPMRILIDPIPTKDITNLCLIGLAKSLSQYYYFNNIKHLVIYNLDNELIKWLETYVNYSQIKSLDLSNLNQESNTYILLLPFFKNIISLRIQSNDLFNYQNIYLKNPIDLEYLDISGNNHDFNKENLIIISKLFPNLKHLSINTTDLSNIPLIGTYLPKLYSLTYKIRDKLSYSLLQRNKEWITIWIDQTVFDNPYGVIHKGRPSKGGGGSIESGRRGGGQTHPDVRKLFWVFTLCLNF